ncbi:hypothetical protein [Vannielia litorea]|uniref:Uncharacterized protein n=1 Tax=Vannielia litorea TaxID=1217970 RepID=A0A1N6FJ59_9RHOB|nr:hypothetical protein [Vannielia litorea]SIN95240.1 hypothetical protein SAMN05444002_1708 [Vannielia litorea]
MTERTETLTRASAPAFAHEGSYVDWPAILAGAVVASAVGFVFATFGAALGLSIISPYDGDGSAMAAAIAVGSWMLWTTISSFATGGYIAGRMRRRVDGAGADEVGVRDGIHGLAVWGVGVLVGAWLLGMTAGTTVQATTEVAGAAATVVEEVAQVTTEGEAAAQVEATTAEAAEVSPAEARDAAETARIYSVISAFVLAASLMIAGAAAYWAASVGGLHRDEGRTFGHFGRWT